MHPDRSIYREKADALRIEGLRLYAEGRPGHGFKLVREARKWERTARRIEWLYGDGNAKREEAA